jgi:hypothetical protein
MVVIRCTKKLLNRFPPPHDSRAISTTRLGDWFANEVWVGRQRYILLVNATTRLPVVIPARDVRNIGLHLRNALIPLLQAINVPAAAIEREVADMVEWCVAPTNDRSVLGSINEFTHMMKASRLVHPDHDPYSLSVFLARTPIMALGGIYPDKVVPDILAD